MLNISFLTHNDLTEDFSRNNKVSLIESLFPEKAEGEDNFFNFSKIMISKLPDNLISHLNSEDLRKFLLELYKNLQDRKKKRYYINSFNGITDKFIIGNFSILTLITDDRPFLVDSLREYFYEINLNQQFIIHPILSIKRNNKGEVVDVSEPYIGSSNESFVVVFISNISNEELEKIKAEVEDIYENVLIVVDDYPKMLGFLKQLEQRYHGLSTETSDFISWLISDKFIIQGVRVISNIKSDNEFSLDQMGVYKFNRTTKLIPSIINAVKNNKILRLDNYPIVVDKAIYKSKVKKRKNYDRIILISGDKDNLSIISIIGVFTKDALKSNPMEISLIKNKIKKIIEHFNFVNGSHDHKWLIDIIESFPKIEIFNFDEKTLIEIMKTIFSIQGKNQIRLYYKTFPPQKNLYIFLAIPYEKYSSELVNDLKESFEKFLTAKTLDISVRHDEHGYNFIHFNLYTKELITKVDENKLKSLISELIKGWEEEFYNILSEELPGYEADRVYDTYVNLFPENYKVKCSPYEAVFDINNLKKLSSNNVYSSLYIENNKLIIKIYKKQRMLLTDIMPIVDNIGLKVNEEDIFEIKSEENNSSYIHSIYLDCINDAKQFYENFKQSVPELVENVILDNVENDRLNKLVIASQLNYREIDLLRAIRNYLEQINSNFKRNTIDDALLNNSEISKLFIEYFLEKFEPSIQKRSIEKIVDETTTKIESVKSVVEDRILRCFMDILKNMIRTNFFIKPTKNYISFKISSKTLNILPDPKPLYEIYVHSSNMEGIHLRGGKVARGGLRFSDRHDDFRTEILGLMKTQMVKNTVIVPVGSKGGFIVKKRFDDSNLDKIHVIEQYKTLIRGLLDITDNYVGKKVVHPQNVVIYDEKDPYLVVAADKGTATFSDIANAVSIEYGFWLGDAFASGGSAGYDHKKVGITAKGAWESVKRHFREMGKDIQREPFTVIGIGDMSGDVFGNGMLLSKQIKLIAAFNHMHIFIDPDPDPSTSFNERLRLFKLPKSAWSDYNKNLISKGGGIFERSAKKIELSPEMKAMFKTDKNFATGEELIKMILKCNAELLWNGGIGTYVKDSSETNAEVGDKLNDNVRIDAEELQVKVVGEGGNLGFTQKGRIKFALLGGKINTDAVDNSAGVDMSDHEVNLKILLSHLMKTKEIKDLKERNKIISALTDEVTKLVLRDNFEQSRILSIEAINAENNILPYKEAANYLKDIGLLNFEIEKIEFIKENRGITRPELAVLMAYTKLFLFDKILEDVDINEPILKKLYESYYPKTLLEKYGHSIYEHKLIKEILATVMVNKFVNQFGFVNYLNLHNLYGKDFYRIMLRYFQAEELFNLSELRNKLDQLDEKKSTSTVYTAFIEIEKTLAVATEWMLNDTNFEMLQNNKELFIKILQKIGDIPGGDFKKIFKAFEQDLISKELPSNLAYEVARIKFSKPAFDLFEVVVKESLDIELLIKNYYQMSEVLNFKLLTNRIKDLKPNDHWDNVNKDNLLKKIKILQKKFAHKVTFDPEWYKNIVKKEKLFFSNYFSFVKSLEEGDSYSLIPYNVILESLDKIVQI
ncbi:NAD-glutamate dehydrogenase domain-containing protein [Calditerrivibrio sp.]|uniref:NAD-glutamate dehydrogenase domain-containing protein n=1 Tax=Calditerrivibrio sp. TaxID=2792612 RepID=UPI003D13207A